mmetsp:Transcript_8335/g.18007  ORF Transcript_8335/g.18007 Transcript_8335/m.18007 type:complete len:199 (-) Transcript_8335:31-627(-)|eukprot:CAMPEP_0178472962 /NCGR_PEP_ID=MMETSP0696-20121128/1839_1 /TAXON_ID=265572 /ORGANISM="Extubocellulus spinifer, Strain CCMP396" /LENGTH=198 /DNA_ID=CAMNT_0020100165 /DNA_START=312 /DNA_END=908 /DNA_ORIENTATION=+
MNAILAEAFVLLLFFSAFAEGRLQADRHLASTDKLCIFSTVSELTDDCSSPLSLIRGAYYDYGHAGLVLVDKSGEKNTYGLWQSGRKKKKVDKCGDSSKSDCLKNYSEDVNFWKDKKNLHVYCKKISSYQRLDFLSAISEPRTWLWAWDNCASMASEVFEEVTGIDVDADDWFLGKDTPCELGKSIDERREMNGGNQH